MNSTNLANDSILEQLKHFLGRASGLEAQYEGNTVYVKQAEDWKILTINTHEIGDLLFRTDRDGSEFVQVNFIDNRKMLITQNLIGFKPCTIKGLNSSKIPKVVTTPDAISVFEAINDCIHETPLDYQELHTLKQVFSSILLGAESVGFDMENEKSWLQRLVITDTTVA